MPVIHMTSQPDLLVWACLTALVACYGAVSFGVKGYNSGLWSVMSALTLGVGIWAAHFTALQAMSPSVYVGKDWVFALLSLLSPVVLSFLLMVLLTRPKLDRFQWVLASVLCTIDILIPHFIGLNIGDRGETIQFDPVLEWLAVGLALGGSLIGFYVLFRVRRQDDTISELRRVFGSLVLSFGIVAGQWLSLSGLTLSIQNDAHGVLMQAMATNQILMAVIAIFGLVLILFMVANGYTNHRYEKALRRAERTLRETLHQQPGMTVKYRKEDQDFIITLCDGSLAGKFGFTSTPVGRSLRELLPHSDRYAQIVSHFQQAWAGYPVVYESERGGMVYLASHHPVMRYGTVVEVIATYVDVTPLKEAQAALRETETKYRMIAENTTDLIRIVDADLNISYASPSHTPVLGYQHEELLHMNSQAFIHLDDIEGVKRAMAELVHGMSPQTMEYRCKHADGRFLLFESRAMPVISDKGEVTQIVVVSRDITEQKAALEALRKSDKLWLAGQLAAGVAHEVRNPLTVVKGFVQLLGEDPVANAEYLPMISSELARIETIINEFLMLAKPQKVKHGPIDIMTVLADIASLLQAQAMMNNVQILLQPLPPLCVVFGSEGQLKQVFVNVLKNAVEAMPGGGTVRVEACADESRVVVRIEDEGKGIPQERIDRLGEPFYTTKEKGTGLGLMVTYNIVREHHGDVRVYSEENHGTCVEISLPLASRSELAQYGQTDIVTSV